MRPGCHVWSITLRPCAPAWPRARPPRRHQLRADCLAKAHALTACTHSRTLSDRGHARPSVLGHVTAAFAPACVAGEVVERNVAQARTLLEQAAGLGESSARALLDGMKMLDAPAGLSPKRATDREADAKAEVCEAFLSIPLSSSLSLSLPPSLSEREKCVALPEPHRPLMQCVFEFGEKLGRTAKRRHGKSKHKRGSERGKDKREQRQRERRQSTDLGSKR